MRDRVVFLQTDEDSPKRTLAGNAALATFGSPPHLPGES